MLSCRPENVPASSRSSARLCITAKRLGVEDTRLEEVMDDLSGRSTVASHPSAESSSDLGESKGGADRGAPVEPLDSGRSGLGEFSRQVECRVVEEINCLGVGRSEQALPK